MNQRRWMPMLIIAFLLHSSATIAAPGVSHEYAVLSLIGDNLTIVQFSTTTGTMLNKTPRTLIPVKTPMLDDVALLAVEEAVKRADTGARLDLLSSSDPVLYQFQNGLFSATGDSATVQSALRSVLKNSTADRLILVSKHRADAHFQLVDSLIGEGKLEGLGYYIDNTISLKMVDSGATDVGFLAPFAYLKVSLIDASSLLVLRTKLVSESEIIANAGSIDAPLNAWQVLTQKEKIEHTTKLIQRAIRLAIPDVVGSSPP
jgi:hypothetical protein